MAQITSGKVLREARERKGYDLNTVARRLRIRPDILRAIEAGDFSTMPPRGYTRNMVNAYARLLGLNPTEIVNMYLDEAYANQVERARGSNSSGFNMDRDSRRSRSRTSSTTSTNRYYESGRTSTIRGTGTQATRVLYDDGTRYSRDDYGVTRERSQKPGRSERDFLSHHSGYDAGSTGFLDEPVSGRRPGRSVHVGETPMSYTASRIPAFLKTRAAIIVAAVVAVLLIAGVAFAVSGARSAEQKEDVSKLPVSGVNDTTGDSSSSAAPKVEVAPTSSRVIYSVPSGKECYVETYLDGQMTPEMLSGPVERSVEVTGVWVITTYSPETLELTVDGTKAELKVDSKYNGMYSYTVDFPAILAQWNSAHGISSSSAKTSTSTSTSNAASSGAAATSTSTTQGQGQNQSQTYEQEVNYDESLNMDEGANAEEQWSEDGEQQEEYYDETQYDDGSQEWQEYDETQYYEEPTYTEEYEEQ